MRMMVLCGALLCFLLVGPAEAKVKVRGIYVTQWTLQKTSAIKQLIRRAKAAGINTFIIDVQRKSRYYARNIQLVKKSDLRYVARIVVFPNGGSPDQVASKQHWERKYRLVEYAIKMGADEIQLDYIRYHTKVRASRQNAKNIHKVIKWFKGRVAKHGVPLQIAVFGETSFGPSRAIGQNIKLFAGDIDVLCPMLYPSHYEPHPYPSRQPYRTVADSIDALKRQFSQPLPFKLYPYIETSNYRYRMAYGARVAYIRAQIKAVEDSGADGWYFWSANNKYYTLFRALGR